MKRNVVRGLLIAGLAIPAMILTVGCSSEESKTPKVTGGTTLDMNAKPESRNSGGSKGGTAPPGGSTASPVQKN